MCFCIALSIQTHYKHLKPLVMRKTKLINLGMIICFNIFAIAMFGQDYKHEFGIISDSYDLGLTYKQQIGAKKYLRMNVHELDFGQGILSGDNHRNANFIDYTVSVEKGRGDGIWDIYRGPQVGIALGYDSNFNRRNTLELSLGCRFGAKVKLSKRLYAEASVDPSISYGVYNYEGNPDRDLDFSLSKHGLAVGLMYGF